MVMLEITVVSPLAELCGGGYAIRLREVDPGFRVEDRVTASLVLPRESRRPYGPLVRVARRCAACCRCLPAGISWKCAGAMSTPRVLRPPQGRGASRECES
jgi:hypothetical protein